MEIGAICEKFNLPGKLIQIKMINSGIINNTYEIHYVTDKNKKQRYIIQKINKNVFKRPDLVMDNIVRISKHIIQKMQKNSIQIKRNVLEYITTQNGYSYFIDGDGEYWRCYKFINDSVTYNITDDLFVIEQAGLAFGQFQSLLSDFDASSLHVSIPNFHNTNLRFKQLFNSVDIDVASRADKALEEIEYLKSKENLASSLCRQLDLGELPLKVTHNDTKCNNVLFDVKTHEALAVIDLDTVMPGLVAYDFGDAIRCIASTCDEDEIDLSKIKIDFDKLNAFTKGFVKKVGSSLTEKEFNSLSTGILVITLELASRFLKDYLDGDIYFKIKYDDHNLIRAKCQIELAKQFEENFEKIKQIISSYR